MVSFSQYISTRSTLFGFAAVILLSVIIVVSLLVQVDTWSRTTFDLVKNNAQQARLVLVMRDAVQKRELIIQRMLNNVDVFARDEQSVDFIHFAGVYANAREALMKMTFDNSLKEKLEKLDEAVAYAKPYHDNLIESLVFDSLNISGLDAIILEGRRASSKVVFLLDKIVESQPETYNKAVAEYEQSRQYTLIGIASVFGVIIIVVIMAVRTSGRQFKHVSQLSIIDDITGTYNRRYFDMVLEEEWRRSMREYTPLSLLMVDIDFFKAYNDSYGHQMGDVCLYTVGKILSGQLKRAADFTARYGGEEFAIVLPNTNMEYARLLAERLRRSVEEARIETGDDSASPWVTVSVGIATTTAEFDQKSASLVKAADQCLYDSKHNGRNKVTDKMLEDL